MRCRQLAKPLSQKPRWPSILVFVCCHGAGRYGYAAPPQSAPETRAATATDGQEGQSLKEAERHFQRGEAHYTKGEYNAAASAFHAAFDLTGEPMLLFNEAQAHRLASACGPARERYEQFLRLHGKADATATLARQHLEQLPVVCERPLIAPPDPPDPAEVAPETALAPADGADALGALQPDRVSVANSHNTSGAIWSGAAAAVFAGTATVAWLWNREQRERLALDEQGLDRVLPVTPGETAEQSRTRHEQMVSDRRDQVALLDGVTLGAAVASGVALGITLYLWVRQGSHRQVEAAASPGQFSLAGRF